MMDKLGCEYGQRDLHQHANKEPQLEHVQRDTHKQLVEEG
jgi:hypothetical protein